MVADADEYGGMEAHAEAIVNNQMNKIVAYLSSGMLNGTGDGTEREGIADDLIAMLEASTLEHKH